MRTNGPLAVIVPFRNEVKTLSVSLDSILMQTAPPAQIILVDDGSTDGSTDIAAEYCSHPGWIMLRAHGEGVAAARNLALDRLDAEYVTFLDADDALAPHACASLISTAKHYNADVVFGGHGFLDRWKRLCPIPYLRRFMAIGPETNLAEVAEVAVDIPVVTGMLARIDLLSNGNIQFPPLKYHEDCVFSAAAWAAASDYRALKEFVYIRRPQPRETKGLTDIAELQTVTDRLSAMDLVDEILVQHGDVKARSNNYETSLSTALLSLSEIQNLSERAEAFDVYKKIVRQRPELMAALEKCIGVPASRLFEMPVVKITPTWCRYVTIKAHLTTNFDHR